MAINGMKVIDCWVNYTMPLRSHMQRLVGHRVMESQAEGDTDTIYLFGSEAFERTKALKTPEDLISAMDIGGIDQSILAIPDDEPEPALKVLEKYPDRLFGAALMDVRKGMTELKRLDAYVRDYPVKAAVICAAAFEKPYNASIYYPLYTKCIELDIAVVPVVGIAGPRWPSEVQNPIYLDEVCWFFPELRVVMSHIGEPWQFTCVKLMLKWDNLFLDTASFAPKHYPKEIVYFLNTRGTNKVIFGTDYPVLTFERCIKEVQELGLKEQVLPKFFAQNAIKAFKLDE